MEFQAKAIESESWDNGKVDNNEVYKSKQKAQMLRRISNLDQSILIEPGINVFKRSGCVPEFKAKLFQKNFKFEQCRNFYYQWYANHVRNLA